MWENGCGDELVFNMLLHRSGQAGKACLINTVRTLTWHNNMKLALVVIFVSIYTTFFQGTLQHSIG